MNILITGGSGFIGKHILHELSNTSHRIGVITRNVIPEFDSLKIIQGDLKKLAPLKDQIYKFNPDLIIHLAWEGIPDFSESISKINLDNSISLFDYILENTNCKKILISGSCFEYGKKIGVCKESDSIGLVNSYFTWAKYSLYQYLLLKCNDIGVILNWFRIFYVYGPGQRKGSLIPTLIESIANKKVPNIKTPQNRNDFIYVKDIAKTFTKAVKINLPSGIYNLGSGVSTSVYDICCKVEDCLLGTKSISENVLLSDEKNETINFWADMDVTENSLQLKIDTSLDEGIIYHLQSLHK